MERKKWPKWLTDKNFEKYNYASFVGYEDGYFTVILEEFFDQTDRKKVKFIWDKIYSYMETKESYREDVWIGEEEEYWPFYRREESLYISTFKSINTIYQEDDIYHYVILGEQVVDILSGPDPTIVILDSQENTIKEFSEINGGSVDVINGQTRFGYSLSENEDFYEIPDIICHNGFYKGSVIKFYDFKTGQVFTPFELEKNIQYGVPVYLNKNYYFLQVDYTKALVTIYKYYPQDDLQKLEQFEIKELNLYNPSLMGSSSI